MNLNDIDTLIAYIVGGIFIGLLNYGFFNVLFSERRDTQAVRGKLLVLILAPLIFLLYAFHIDKSATVDLVLLSFTTAFIVMAISCISNLRKREKQDN